MSRPKTLLGKRRVIGLKVSDAKFDAVESARGETPRALWVEAAIDKALAAGGVSRTTELPAPARRAARKTPAGPPGAKARDREAKTGPPPPARVPPRHAPGQGVFQAPGEEAVVTSMPPAPAAARTRCGHQVFRVLGSGPGTRSVNGCCPDCKHRVEPGGLWALECDAGTCGGHGPG